MEKAVEIFLLCLKTVQNIVPLKTAWALGISGDACRARSKNGGVLVVIPVAKRQAFKYIGVFVLLCRSGFHEMLGYVSYRLVAEIDWGADYAIGSILYVCSIVAADSVTIFHRDSNKRDVISTQGMI